MSGVLRSCFAREMATFPTKTNKIKLGNIGRIWYINKCYVQKKTHPEVYKM